MQTTLARPRTFDAARPSTWLGPANRPLIEALFPSISTVQKVVVALVFIGILVGVGRARFYLPENPVPITLSTFGVLLTAGVLGFRWGLASVVAWYFLGMAGVPVFQGGGNGWAYVSGSPTGGYLIGFIAAIAVVGYLSQHGWNRGRGLWPMLTASLLIYVPGLLWLGSLDILPWNQVFSKGMYPFVPGDLVKLMGASLVTAGLWTIADRRNSRRGTS